MYNINENIENRKSMNIRDLRKRGLFRDLFVGDTFKHNGRTLHIHKGDAFDDWNIELLATEKDPYSPCVINLECTRCHYGNTRNWFLCPKCSRRSAILYEDKSGYICRMCTGLKHMSKTLNFNSLEYTFWQMNKMKELEQIGLHSLTRRQLNNYHKLAGKVEVGINKNGAKYLGK